MSAAIALRLAMVSSSDSPLAVELHFERVHVGTQARGGNVERGAGALFLKEQVKHALAAQQRYFLDLAVADMP